MQVPNNEAFYGADDCGTIVCSGTWVRPTTRSTRARLGRIRRQQTTRTSRSSIWGSYDFDGDGNFNEPDGYIDHFQSIHAGRARKPAGCPGRRNLVAPLVAF